MQLISKHVINETRFAVRTSTGVYFFNFNEVTYCEAEGRYTHLHLKNGKIITVAKLLKDFEEKLPKDYFVRVHRSNIVNIKFITGVDLISKNHLIINNKNKIVISRRRKKILNEILNKSITYI